VDVQPLLRALQVPDREATIAMSLRHFMLPCNIRCHRIYANAEQAACTKTILRRSDVRVRARAISVLEYLNSDDDGVLLCFWQRGHVPMNEPASSPRRALHKLLQSPRGNVETNQIETGGDEGQIVPALAAADVDALSPDQAASRVATTMSRTNATGASS
jgi:hypothetical protein